jgi:UPF0176 protein
MSPSPAIHVTSFYRFIPLDDLKIENLKSELERLATDTGLLGLCLLGPEGINATLSGPAEVLNSAKALVNQGLGVDDVVYKDSVALKQPFHVFRIKIKDEIVTMGKPGFAPISARNKHLSPEEWHMAMQDPKAVILDTRNDYEVEIGKFKGARDFALKEFRDFPAKVSDSGIGKDTPILMYCTGGIRCEKAILEMNAQGFENVRQLEGGILNYLEKFPNQAFEGECFVFDYRVAVDQQLQPTQNFKLCPHCGQPANKPIVCVKCGTEAVLCRHCTDQFGVTCSKNCAHHVEIGSGSKRAHKQELTKRHKI